MNKRKQRTSYCEIQYSRNMLRLRQLQDARERMLVYISRHGSLNDTQRQFLTNVVEEVIGKASKQEAAEYVSDLVNAKIAHCVGRIMYHLECCQLGSMRETAHVRSGTLIRTRRTRAEGQAGTTESASAEVRKREFRRHADICAGNV